MRRGRFAAAIAEYGAAAFVGHADGGEKRPGTGACVHRGKGKPGFLVHFPDTGGCHVLAAFHKTGGKFVDVVPQRVTVLADEDNSVLLLSVYAEKNDAVGLILPGNGLELLDFLCPGSDKIRRGRSVPVDGLEFIKVQKPGIRQFFDLSDLAHCSTLQNFITLYYSIIKSKKQ